MYDTNSQIVCLKIRISCKKEITVKSHNILMAGNCSKNEKYYLWITEMSIHSISLLFITIVNSSNDNY